MVAYAGSSIKVHAAKYNNNNLGDFSGVWLTMLSTRRKETVASKSQVEMFREYIVVFKLTVYSLITSHKVELCLNPT